ncbi:MAG: carboxyl-terminal processing protease [Myxococcota bacterium]
MLSTLWALFCLLMGVARADDGAEAVQDAVQLIQQQLPEQIDEALLYHAALVGITGYLNQQAGASIHDVLTEQEHGQIEAWLRGERDGIGAIYQIISGQGVLLEEVFTGGPAAAAGMNTGDLIVAIDDQPFTGLSDAMIYELTSQAALRPQITLDVMRADQSMHRFEVLRGRYQIKAVSAAAESCAIDLLFFSKGAAARLEELMKKIPDGSGLLLDLRDNQGGLLEEALAAASLFLEGGAVITYRRRSDGVDEALVATGNRRWSAPVVILTNERTSGTAEVFASALQDHRAATLVGSTTTGRAAEPGYYPVGSGLVLQLADTNLRAPSGRSWAGTGLIPDVRVEPLQQRLSLSTPGVPPDIQRDTGIQLIACP